MVNKQSLYSLARVGNLSAIIQLDQSEILDLFLHDSERLPVRSFAAWFHHDRIAQKNIEAKAKKTPGFPVLIINDSSTDKKTQCIPLWLEIQKTSLGYISTCNFDAVVQQVVLHLNNIWDYSESAIAFLHPSPSYPFPATEITGTSHALAVAFCWLEQQLSVGPKSNTRDICGRTIPMGGWDDHRKCFIAVKPETIKQKCMKAHDLGYRRLIVIDGQEGLDDPWIDENFEVIPYPSEVKKFITKALQSDFTNSIYNNRETSFQHIEKIHRLWSSGTADDKLQEIPPTIEALANIDKQELNEAKFHANLILSKHFTHKGKTDKALEYWSISDALLPECRFEHASSSELAHVDLKCDLGMLLIDSFRWEDKRFNELNHLQQHMEAHCKQHPWDTAAIFNLIKLSNTLSFRHLFLFKIHGETHQLKRALELRSLCQDSWETTFNYASNQFGKGDNLQRHCNYMIEIAWTAWLHDQYSILKQCNTLITELRVELSNDPKHQHQGDNSFNRLYEWCWAAIHQETSHHDLSQWAVDCPQNIDVTSPQYWQWERQSYLKLKQNIGGGYINPTARSWVLKNKPEELTPLEKILSLRTHALVSMADDKPVDLESLNIKMSPPSLEIWNDLIQSTNGEDLFKRVPY